jgi:S-adenosylmethionine synthetase
MTEDRAENTDLVERLRSRRKSGYDSTEQGGQPDKLCDEAADALATLSANLDAMMRERDAARAVHEVDQRAFLSAIARAETAEAEVARLTAELDWKLGYWQERARKAEALLPANKEG